MAIHAPGLDGAIAWLNVDRPLTLAELRGQLVVLDFWTYCCINCMHVIPTLRAIEHALADEPLVVIGVHSGKFDEERDPARIAEAIERYDIEHPVAVDDEMRLWSRYAVRSWPTLVVIRPDGTIAAVAPGEPERELLLAFLRRELDEARRAGTLAKAPFRPPFTAREATTPLRFPGKVAVASDGRLAIADSGHHRVLVTDASGRVLASVGSGLQGLVDGSFGEAAFCDPQGVAWDGERVVVADARNHAVREIDLVGKRVTTLAGTGALGLRLPNAARPAREVALRSPWDVSVDGDRLYVAMAGSHQLHVYHRTSGTIAPLAGTGAEALVDGPAHQAVFAQPSGLWLDRARRRLYLADSETSSVRYLDLTTMQVHTLVGEGLFDFGDVDGDFARARLQHDLGVCGRDGLLYVVDTYNSKVKRLDERRRVVETVIASGLREPGGLCFAPDGTLVVADTNQHRLLRFDAQLTQAQPIEITGAPAPLRGIARAPRADETSSTATRRAGDSRGWFTAQLALADGVSLGPGDDAIALTLEAPDGTELADGSPLAFELEVSRRPDLLHVDGELHLTAPGGTRATVEIPARVSSLSQVIESELLATVRFVACDKRDRAVCTPGQARLRIPVRLSPTGERRLRFDVPLPPVA